jgi:hypothetical protein
LARSQLNRAKRSIVVLPEADPALDDYGTLAATLPDVVTLTSERTFQVRYITESPLEFEFICWLAWQRGNLTLTIDEIHEFVPSHFGSIPLPFKRVVLRGSKRHINVIGISQRPANIHKDLLSQAAALRLYVFKLGWADDFASLKKIIPDVERAQHFKVGEFICWPPIQGVAA